jgi:uncharacterized protein
MLLMTDGPDRAPVAAQTVRVEAGEVAGVAVRQGQLLKIVAAGECAVACLYGFSDVRPDVFLSVHHTRVFSNSYLLVPGMRLVTNRRRPMMVLGKDSVGHHDLLFPASTTEYLAARGYAGQIGCADAVSAEIKRLGLAPPKLPDPVNLFLRTQLHRDGRIEPMENGTESGDHVIFRVLIDSTFIVSACCTGIEGNDRTAPLELRVAEDLSDL